MNYEVVAQIGHKYSTLRRFEHLEVDVHFCIVDKSEQAQRFASQPKAVILGKDIRVGFPEFVGKEDILQAILQGEQEICELSEIKRTLDNQTDIYINIYIISHPQKKTSEMKLMIFMEDVTEKINLNQDLLKITNATNLLSMTLVACTNYMDTVIGSMADALLVTTKNGKIKKVNMAAQKLFDFAEAELINQPISLIFDDNFLLLRIINHYSKINRNLQHFEVVCRKKTGEKVLVAFSCAVMQKKNEVLEDIIYIGRDITSRQHREQRNNAQYAITRILAESPSIKQTMKEILQAICQSLEWDVGELWTSSEYINTNVSEDSENVILRCVEIWSSRVVSVREYKAVTWQTTYLPGVGLPGKIWDKRYPLWIKDILEDGDLARSPTAVAVGLRSGFGFPILDDNKILGVMTFFSRDVQPKNADLLQMMVSVGSQIAQFIKRKQAEDNLLESESRYRDICENANDLIQSVNIYGKLLYVNQTWRKTLGYSAAEISQMTVFDIIHPDYQIYSRQLFSRLMLGEQLEQIKTAFIAKNGQIVYAEGNISCKIVDGKPVSTRCIFRNITQKVALEAAWQNQPEPTQTACHNCLPVFPSNLLQSPDSKEYVTILCADIVGLGEITAAHGGMQLVNLLCQIFATFDRLSHDYGLEKVKTINDVYVVMAGLPTKRGDHAQVIGKMALEMQSAIAKFNTENQQNFKISIAIHTDVFTADAITLKNTINIAKSLQSQTVANTILVTATSHAQLCEEFCLERQGEMKITEEENITTYLLLGKKQQPL